MLTPGQLCWGAVVQTPGCPWAADAPQAGQEAGAAGSLFPIVLENCQEGDFFSQLMFT